MADILKRLESRNLVSRVIDPENRRRKLCLATPLGQDFVTRYRADMQRSQKQLLSPLSTDEQAVFMELLARLVQGNNEGSRTALRPGGEQLDI